MGLLSLLPTAPTRFLEPKRIAAPDAEQWDGSRLDFWNDPRRWDDIADSHKTLFWMVRRPDVIDVRAVAKTDDRQARLQHSMMNAANPYLFPGLGQMYPDDLLNIQPGSIVRYSLI